MLLATMSPFNGFASLHPSFEASCKVKEFGEIKPGKLLARLHTSHATGAMNQIRSALVEQGCSFLKIRRIYVKVHGAWKMARLKLRCCTERPESRFVCPPPCGQSQRRPSS